MKIVCIQQIAKDVNSFKETWKHILFLIDEAAAMNVDLMVLPECAYPAYYLGYNMETANTALEHLDEFVRDVSAKAMLYSSYIAIGTALKKDNKIVNGGLLFDRDGEIILNCSKCNLWHFDRKWFSSGTEFGIAETDFGKVGMMICADGRAPEIARILALKGADLIIDPANLTSTGNDSSKLTNPQAEYMLPTRALENGVWIAMADKVGLEANSILYAGSSCIINPEGEIVASASPDKEEIVYAEIDSVVSKRKLPRRNPNTYSILTKPTEELPIYKDMIEPVLVRNTEMQTAVIQFEYSMYEEFINKAADFIKVLEDQDCSLIIFPQLERGMDLITCINTIRTYISRSDTLVSISGYNGEGDYGSKSAVIFSKDKIFSTGGTVIDTPLCKIGIMHDEEGLIPEAARCLMLEGAAIVLWYDGSTDTKANLVTRTRASENKIFLIRIGGKDEKDFSTIINPDGRIIASTISGIDQSTSAMIVTALSKSKTVVPGTNVVLDRKPFLYEVLTK